MITRFAPSPSGYLHLGHAYAAWVAMQWGKPMLLRHEDIDQMVCRPEFVTQIEDDLQWLGIEYHRPASFQARRYNEHRRAVQQLVDGGFCYPCFCSRADIRRAARAPHVKESLYPGTCRALSEDQRRDEMARKPYAYRLDMAKALQTVGDVCFYDYRFGNRADDPNECGDVVVMRKQEMMSYHIAVVWDDAEDKVDLVTRGEDLLPLTPIHIVLQKLLGLPTPAYLHHHLICDQEGKRLAKRSDSYAIKQYREDGISATDLFARFPHYPQDFPSNF